jgi:hypothetical protein
MKIRLGYRALALAAAAVMTAPTDVAQAQGQPRRVMAFEVAPDGQAQEMTFRASTAVEARITTGRPYSAEATTEFTQVLGDGNRIARKVTHRIYRDSDGRTRREELAADGSVKSISIYDTVGHVTYVLDPATRTARRSAVRVVLPDKFVPMTDEDKRKIEDKLTAAPGAGGRAPETITLVGPVPLPERVQSDEAPKRMAAETVARGRGRAVGPQPFVSGSRVGKEEALGQKLIEGVMADGKRVTTTLPAGAIGNQAPITVTSEQWFSPDLEILVMTRHSDPRSGETSYTLANIVRAEPQATLFDLPSDYTVVGSGYMRYPSQR